ncbi:branched-chain amino acid ABC transporter permease [Desulfococcus multivorans]|uniref:ABC-type transporter, integral membrane subunit n=1 Tax=Desulfococcus multivorans DSM 2059 TaxID=1121405 RepID=S7U5U8_DESML|nr:branched-chain amino acid ABC transporter permease [Desulfococcus multivorans]AOY59074.1 ABC-type branched-chain amino acid transport-system, permease component [Desulfococcus multivorans]AQV01322.1 branched-chain amino acid ABC transporter permease [Desulfococcus multivorans]EPR44886.1 ABC-type transporter, integral membrane subunit [Desulfococcus multivorans DSM 2059]SJZ82599.1 amino acid/amide ABC transporter membrane protein 1, HAAT family (TC 3.A.1.4.-) [Desulfococcus multivorans DSM 20
MEEFAQYVFSGLTNGAIYAVIAIGFSMLFSATELINFAHGEFVMLGALGLVTLWGELHLPLLLAVVMTVGGVAMAGLLFERIAIRTVSKPHPIVLVIITVGASIFLRGAAMIIWGKDARSVPPFSDHPPLDLAGAKLLPQSIWILVIAVLLAVGLFYFYRKTLTGKAMQATAINKRGAWLSGIPSEKMVLLAFVMSTGLGATAGVIIAPITMCGYDMGTLLGLKGFCAAMLGGIGSLWGSLAGGFLLGLLEALGVGYISSAAKDAVAFVLLLLILYIKPGGLFGAADASRF